MNQSVKKSVCQNPGYNGSGREERPRETEEMVRTDKEEAIKDEKNKKA